MLVPRLKGKQLSYWCTHKRRTNKAYFLLMASSFMETPLTSVAPLITSFGSFLEAVLLLEYDFLILDYTLIKIPYHINIIILQWPVPYVVWTSGEDAVGAFDAWILILGIY